MRRWWLAVPVVALAAAAVLLLPGRSARDDGLLAGVEAVLYRSPTCGCCAGYAEFLQQQGATVKVVNTHDMAPVKARLGVPASAQSCHTVEMAGYVIEGHVPLAALEDLLAERPDIDGIALPGMPSGTPGMPGERPGVLDVLTLDGGAVGLFGPY
jgi:hypothetical protein